MSSLPPSGAKPEEVVHRVQQAEYLSLKEEAGAGDSSSLNWTMIGVLNKRRDFFRIWDRRKALAAKTWCPRP